MSLKINGTDVIDGNFTSIRVPVSSDSPPFNTQRPDAPIKGSLVLDANVPKLETYSVGTISTQTAIWKNLQFTIPTPNSVTFALQQDTGASSSDWNTQNGTIVVSGVNVINGYWDYSITGGSTWSAPQSTNISTFVLPEGFYAVNQVQVRQTNAVGYSSAIATNSVAIRVDTTAPIITVDTISGDNILTFLDAGATTITGTVNESVSSLSLNFNGTYRSSTISGLNWSYLITGADLAALGDGVNKSIGFIATDPAGNSTSVSKTVDVYIKLQQEFTTPGTYTWICPPDVTSVSVVCVGAGGGGASALNGTPGGGGGALAWSNSMPVIPGSTLTVNVGTGGTTGAYGVPSSGTAGTQSKVSSSGGGNYTWSVTANGGGAGTRASSSTNSSGGSGGTYSFSGYASASRGGGNGGGAGGSSSSYAGGGGGAGGYTGNGGTGAGNTAGAVGSAGSGGGGGGGSASYQTGTSYGGYGGGVGIITQGSSGGAGAAAVFPNPGNSGGPGSGGSVPDYGGGGPGVTGSYLSMTGGSGAVRIIWGTGRAYPSTNTQNMYIS